MFVDTHCHIHEASYPLVPSEVLNRARAADVTHMICVGTNEQSSYEAVSFTKQYSDTAASIGVHPHNTKDGYAKISRLLQAEYKLIPNTIVAIGEVGLDYFYIHSSREIQISGLEAQLQLALDYNLPVIFHVRDAFDEFWSIFDNFPQIKGVLHSFTDSQNNLDAALSRGLLIGVNGISTFTKDDAQKAMFLQIPLEKMLLETDAPFLTPVPFRGKVNEPAFVRLVAEYHASIRNVTLDHLSRATTANALRLFAL